MNADYFVCKAATEFCIEVLNYTGWNVNMDKSVLLPTQQLLYLGFFTDSINMMYFSPVKKFIVIQELIHKVLDETWISKTDFGENCIPTEVSWKHMSDYDSTLPTYLGLAVHDNMSSVQNWEGFVFLDLHAKVELKYLFDNIILYNGKRIVNSKSR